MRTTLTKALMCLQMSMICTLSSVAQNYDAFTNQANSTAIEYETFLPAGGPTVLLPRTSLLPEQVAIIVNEDDPISASVASYYANARGIPNQNIITVSLNTATAASLNTTVFEEAMQDINLALAGRQDQIQAFVLAWKAPNFFGGPAFIGGAAGSSVCAAFAIGELLENPGGSPSTKHYHHYLHNSFANSNSIYPYTEFGIRPTMHLMTNENTDSSVQALIDMSISSDATFPTGDGYLIKTNDRYRNTRWGVMSNTPQRFNGLNLNALDLTGSSKDYLCNTPDILFYFTGDEVIKDIETNTYLPGAICDHMTSSGGVIGNYSQMFIGEWLDAGATASYGTVTEPTNRTSKFPNVGIVIREYFQGGTIIGSYWKSVYDPSQGYFVGEPLARPYKPIVTYDVNSLVIKTSLFDIDQYYLVEEAGSISGPWTVILPPIILQQYAVQNIAIENADSRKFYRITPDYIPPAPPKNLTARYVPDSILLPCNVETPHCEIRFDSAVDNTGEVAAYKVYIDNKLFDSFERNTPLVRIGYNPYVDVEQLVNVQVKAVDKNGNESALSSALKIDLPLYHVFVGKCPDGALKNKKQQEENNTDGSENEAVAFDLYQNYPNPFKRGTEIGFSIPVEGEVKLSIYALSGQSIWNYEGLLEAGSYSLGWNGQSTTGKRVAPGVYLCKLQFKGHSKYIKMILE